ncbi:MAG TPA: L-threonylcarbamoyladenylate synthase [Pseudogracilibacillus sp.]|nr:L-threonylcarbamoyladenylate synthase [Pseudogracilibacillus sp.]
MKTKRLDFDQDKEKTIQATVDYWKNGEVVAFPTETVYGLGADATNSAAVSKIFQAKERPEDNPLIVHIASKDQLSSLTDGYPAYVNPLIDAFSPGPITCVLKCSPKIAKNVTGGLSTVGIRIPAHPVAHQLLKAAELPIAAPSANLSGKPSPTTAQHVLEDLTGKVPAVVDGGPANVGVESTVVDCTGEHPVILRLGKITRQDIEQIIPVGGTQRDVQTSVPKSPGVKYRHYMPEVPLILALRDETETIRQHQISGKKVGLLTLDSTADYHADKVFSLGTSQEDIAAQLYQALRKMKQSDVDLVIAIGLNESTAGEAVMDRLKKAASKTIE